MSELKKRGRPRKDSPTTIPALPIEKPTNGHLTLRESKRTIILSWGKYSITLLCITAIVIALLQKIKF
jgi:hypothetical protein